MQNTAFFEDMEVIMDEAAQTKLEATMAECFPEMTVRVMFVSCGIIIKYRINSNVTPLRLVFCMGLN